MEVVVLADTHLTGGLERLPVGLVRAIEACDLVLHAGDIVSPRALDELRSLNDVVAVLGNNDRELAGALPLEVALDLEGVTVAMVHDSGPSKGRGERLKRRFSDADLVVFGHSHVPVDAEGIDGQVLFNPGSPTQRRHQPHRSFGRLGLEAGAIRHRSIELVE